MEDSSPLRHSESVDSITSAKPNPSSVPSSSVPERQKGLSAQMRAMMMSVESRDSDSTEPTLSSVGLKSVLMAQIQAAKESLANEGEGRRVYFEKVDSKHTDRPVTSMSSVASTGLRPISAVSNVSAASEPPMGTSPVRTSHLSPLKHRGGDSPALASPAPTLVGRFRPVRLPSPFSGPEHDSSFVDGPQPRAKSTSVVSNPSMEIARILNKLRATNAEVASRNSSASSDGTSSRFETALESAVTKSPPSIISPSSRPMARISAETTARPSPVRVTASPEKRRPSALSSLSKPRPSAALSPASSTLSQHDQLPDGISVEADSNEHLHKPAHRRRSVSETMSTVSSLGRQSHLTPQSAGPHSRFGVSAFGSDYADSNLDSSMHVRELESSQLLAPPVRKGRSVSPSKSRRASVVQPAVMTQEEIDFQERKEEMLLERAVAKELTGVEFPELFSKYLFEAHEAFSQGKYSVACNLYGKLIGMQSNNSEIICMRAACMLRLKMFEMAFADADMASQIDPSFPEAVFIMAESMFQLHDVKRATPLYIRTCDLDPHNPHYRAALSRCLQCADALKKTKRKQKKAEKKRLASIGPNYVQPRGSSPIKSCTTPETKKMLKLPPLQQIYKSVELKHVVRDRKVGESIDKGIAESKQEIEEINQERELLMEDRFLRRQVIASEVPDWTDHHVRNTSLSPIVRT